MIEVPREFAAARIRKSGEAGRRWVRELPALLERFATQWRVRLLPEEVRYGDLAVVVSGWRGDEPCAMKASWRDHATHEEESALRAWDGNGAVRLLRSSSQDGVLLLERLQPDRSLMGADLLPAAEVAGGLVRRLAIPAPAGVERIDEVGPRPGSAAERQRDLGNPLPQRWVDRAEELARDLVPGTGSSLVHMDLHYENVSWRARERLGSPSTRGRSRGIPNGPSRN